jgi:ABC-type glycerol-3-phosphate transport system permease component
VNHTELRGSRQHKFKISKKLGNWLPTVVLFLGLILVLGPFIWMVISSLKTSSEFARLPIVWFPQTPNFANYRKVWEQIPLLRQMANSLFLSTTVTSVILFTSSLVGYLFAKFQFRLRNFLFLFILSSMMIPFFIILIPLYTIIVRFGWSDSYWALVIPVAFSSYGIFWMRQFINTIPDDLLDTARLDGCGEFAIYFRIILPLAKPGLAALGVFLFMWQWGDFLWPLVVLNSNEKWTMALGLTAFSTGRWTLYHLVVTASVIGCIPMVVLFLLLQKSFLEGINLSGMKG